MSVFEKYIKTNKKSYIFITCCWLPEIYLAFAEVVMCRMLTTVRTGRDGSGVDLTPWQWSGHSEQPPESCMHRSILVRVLGLSYLTVCIPTAPVLHSQQPSGCIPDPEWEAVPAAEWGAAIPLHWHMPETQRRRFVIWGLLRLLPDHQQDLWWNEGWGSNLSSLKSLCLSPQNHTFLVEVLSKPDSRKSKST